MAQAQPRQAPTPQPMRSSSDTWQGMPRCSARRVTAVLIVPVPPINNAFMRFPPSMRTRAGPDPAVQARPFSSNNRIIACLPLKGYAISHAHKIRAVKRSFHGPGGGTVRYT